VLVLVFPKLAILKELDSITGMGGYYDTFEFLGYV